MKIQLTLLAVKYIDVLKDIMQMRNTRINLLPKKTAFLITSQALGMNTNAKRWCKKELNLVDL